ncbi:MAG TPA: sensor histidine kinase [Opitutaceae bacterium]|nr:sensor histidine kinase [Opitutaceae bacterium]
MKNNSGCEVRKITPEASLCHRINRTRAKLVSHYRRALRDYLRCKDNARLQAAYELGCIALRSGMGVFDMARLHEETLPKAMTCDGSRAEVAQQARAAETFLLDALSPFEAARRGLPEAYVRLGQLNEMLEQRNKALVEITARQRPMEEALRTSKGRCLKLFQQARSMKKDIRQHSAKMVMAREEERKRISRELHDEIGQVLAAVNVGLGMLKKQAGHDRSFQKRVTATQTLLEQSMESVHRFARELRPEMLDHFGPYEAIRSYARAFSERTGIAATIHSKADLAGLDNEQEIVLFRVAQESITNVFKHAHATRIDIKFHRHFQGVCMEIQDNGRSFSVEEELGKKWKKRLGLLGMQERVRLVRGDFSIESAPGSGTKVRVQFPLAPKNGTASNGNGHRACSHESSTVVLPKTIL